jgi:hypothetical protein
LPSIRAELPVAHGSRGRRTAVRVAASVLVIPSEAGEEPAFLDDPGSAGTCNWTLPLDQSPPERPRDVSPPDVPRGHHVCR